MTNTVAPQGITQLKLVINAPANGAVFVAPGTQPVAGTPPTAGVAFAGHLVNPPAGVTLFYKWYSSLYTPADANLVALNAPNFTQTGGSIALQIGTHVLTFTAKDQLEESVAATLKVKYAGLAGGPPQNPQPPPDKLPPPCVIHVFAAQSLWPNNANGGTYTLIRATAAFPGVAATDAHQGLEAAAPSKWTDTAYKRLNRISYVWRFSGAGQPDVELRPTFEDLLFVPAQGTDGARVRLKGPLPAALVSKVPYIVSLRVEDINPPHQGHDDPVTAKITITG